MKTSNIILLGLVAMIFLIPLLLIASLNSKIKNKEFTVVKNQYERREPMFREGAIGDYSVIKLEGPDPEFFECHIEQSDSASYRYEKYDYADSISVYTKNDTLFVRFIAPDDSLGQKKVVLRNQLELSLKLKSLSSLIVDGADVRIDSLDTKEGFRLILKNNGKISDTRKEHDDQSLNIPHTGEPLKDAVAELDPEKQIFEVVEKIGSMNTEIKDMLIFHLM